MPAELIRSLLVRADKLLVELRATYQTDLNAKAVSNEALNLTHEVIEKCANALDQTMTLAWETRIKPGLAKLPAKGGYFPAARTEEGFRSSMGQWGAADIDTRDKDFAAALRAYQPMTSAENNWLATLRDLSAKKHTGLVPQKRQEERRVTVRGAGGAVSWGSGVRFGSGVSVMGARVDPRTQIPVATPGVTTTVETWVSFHLADTGTDALAFCTNAVAKSRAIVDRFVRDLKLP
jgi:hypothetical protein